MYNSSEEGDLELDLDTFEILSPSTFASCNESGFEVTPFARMDFIRQCLGLSEKRKRSTAFASFLSRCKVEMKPLDSVSVALTFDVIA